MGVSIPGSGNPLQYSCLDNSMDRRALWVTVHRATQNRTWLKGLSTHRQQNHIFYNFTANLRDCKSHFDHTKVLPYSLDLEPTSSESTILYLPHTVWVHFPNLLLFGFSWVIAAPHEISLRNTSDQENGNKLFKKSRSENVFLCSHKLF